jgi:CRISPR-associated protein Cas6/Cse3/CasE subtype I-E
VVQSSLRPDWDYAFKNAPLLAAKPECRDYNPAFEKGQTWRFRILINLSHKAKQSQQGANLTRVRENDFDAHGRPKSQSKRVALTWDQNQNPEPVILNWFQKKAWVCPGAQAAPAQAFSLNHAKVIRLGWVVGWKNIYTQTQSLNHKMKFRSALIEGELEVQDPNAFHRLVAGGMGAAKAFGFGLLSLYPPSQATSPCPTPQPGKP